MFSFEHAPPDADQERTSMEPHPAPISLFLSLTSQKPGVVRESMRLGPREWCASRAYLGREKGWRAASGYQFLWGFGGFLWISFWFENMVVCLCKGIGIWTGCSGRVETGPVR